MYKSAKAIVPTMNIVWDESVANLPRVLERQYQKGKLVYTPSYSEPVKARKEEELKNEPAVYELVMISQDGHSFPTIIKHANTLLTWEDACKVLKEKVD